MNKEERFNDFNTMVRCIACLKLDENLVIMTPVEVNFYQNMVLKFQCQTLDLNLHLCLLCRHLIRKFAKFVEQCQVANEIMFKIEEDTKLLQIKTLHNLRITKTEQLYHGELNIGMLVSRSNSPLDDLESKPDLDLDTITNDDLESKPDLDITINDNLESKSDLNPDITTNDDLELKPNLDLDKTEAWDFPDEDEIPLVMLKGSDDKKTTKKKRKKLKSSSKDVKINTEASAKSKKDKNVKKGFTSRMVQETEEYEVIKLSKEQVLEEMLEKSKEDKYTRAPYKCEKCVKGFNFEDVLQSHLLKHSSDHGKLLCDICSQYCPSTVSLRGHMKSHTTRYKCKICASVRLSRQHLLEHYAITHAPQHTQYSCDQCEFTTNKRTTIQRHMKMHKTNEKYTCHQCGAVFKHIISLRVHIVRHDTSKKFQCEHCKQKFVYPSLLKNHIQSVHVNKDYYCVECDVKFKSKDSLRLHFIKNKVHRDITAYKHKCPECSLSFIYRSRLLAHLSYIHGVGKQHVCEACARQYSSRDGLRQHIRRVHGQKQAKRVTCQVCEKTFSQNYVLRKHMRTHTGERPHACVCGAAFASRTSLLNHQLAKHKKEDIKIETKIKMDTAHEP